MGVQRQQRTKPTSRNPSVEVMRCVLMFMIVFYHGANNGPYSDGTSTIPLKLIPWLLFFCTNAFMFISGWYGIKFGWRRVAKFLGLGLFASSVLSIVSKPIMGEWQWQFTLGWFGNSYLAIMMLAPIVNAGIEKLSEDRMKLVGAWGCFAAIIFTSWLPIKEMGMNLNVPGWCGHAFSTMLFIYVSARVMRLIEIDKMVSAKLAAIIFVAALGLHLSRLAFMFLCPSLKGVVVSSADYDAPEVLIMGAAFFLMCFRLQLPRIVNTVGVLLAPSMFVVYLLHASSDTGMKLMNAIIARLDAWLQFNAVVSQLMSVMLGSVFVFVGCILIDSLRRMVLGYSNRKNECPQGKGVIE